MSFNNGRVWLIQANPVRDESGNVIGAVEIASDITERKRMEDALRESEQRLRTVVTSAPVILFAVDREGVLTFTEGKGLEGMGVTPDKLVGLSIFDVFSDIPDMQEKLHRVLVGEAFTTTVEVAGSTFEVHCAPLRGGNGEVSGATGVATDVTERRRAEDALRENEARYRQIFENVQDAFYRADALGIITGSAIGQPVRTHREGSSARPSSTCTRLAGALSAGTNALEKDKPPTTDPSEGG
jgi:PAS domain S-box-containing protein